MTPRKMRKRLKGIQWDKIKDNPRFGRYRDGGEWEGLTWLKAYSENRAACEPVEYVLSGLRVIGRVNNPGRLALTMETILKYGKED